MSLFSKRIVRISVAAMLIPSLAFSNEFEQRADNYISKTHHTAKHTADMLFVHDLVIALMEANASNVIMDEALRQQELDMQSQLNSILDLTEDDLTAQETLAANTAVLNSLTEIRNRLSGNIAALKARDLYQSYTSAKKMEALLLSLQMLQDSCEKGRAISPLNAGQTMPQLLSNSFSINFNYTYETDSGNSSGSVMASPENPNGDPATLGMLGAAGSLALYYGGPVGWAIAAGIAAVTYVYSSDEKRKTEVEMTDAYLRTLDQQATASDVKKYYIERCGSRKSLLKGVIASLQTRKFPLDAMNRLEEEQKENFKKFESLVFDSTTAGKEKISKFLVEELKADDLVDLTLLSLLKITKDNSDFVRDLQSRMVSSNQYQQMLERLDLKIRLLQKANYNLSLLAQDSKALEFLVRDRFLFVESEKLIQEWQLIFVRSMALSFKNIGSQSELNNMTEWNARVDVIKSKLPPRLQESFTRRSQLLQKLVRG
jgi:hypothetical protein